MRLIELEIHNVRGIPHLLLKPNGRNLVIWGPNGSGKSAVVDAIDFLLTGRISRLLGKGTGGITLNRHGPHIDRKPEEAKVRAVLALQGVSAQIEIERCMGTPGTVFYDDAFRERLMPVLKVAGQGQHVLTRRDILRYVTADPGTRAEEIQALLNISDLEKVRKALVRTRSKLGTEHTAAQSAVTQAERAVKETARVKTFDKRTILEFINEQRSLLGGHPVPTLRWETLKQDLIAPADLPGARPVNLTQFAQDVQVLHSAISGNSMAAVSEQDRKLRGLISDLRSDIHLQRELARRQLTQLGIPLIDDEGDCPLCDKPWPAGKLRDYLEKRLETANAGARRQAEIERLAGAIAATIYPITVSLQGVLSHARLADAEAQSARLVRWHDGLQAFMYALEHGLDKYPDSRFPTERMDRLLTPPSITEVLDRVEACVQDALPAVRPEQDAWDALTRLEVSLKALKKAESALHAAELSCKRARTMLTTFEETRDRVLMGLYDEIGERFCELYRELHTTDEASFTARIRPQGAGIGFEVDFLGRGNHPPHALHSEGHQDSMGLCLYLALAERLTEGMIDLTILDDVVMSIDSGHRRRVCHLLNSVFPDKQFLITTHDKTWAKQLRSDGVVTSRGYSEFSRWTIDTGPVVSTEVDLWESIDSELKRGDVPSAAFRLRRTSEHFFEMACDRLQAPVKYRSSGRWELGDFLPAATSQYRSHLKKAKVAAQSWGSEESFGQLQELDTVAKQVISRINAEWWAVNSSVHYNNWANLEEQDFRPVAEVFQDLYGLLQCNKCGGMLYLACDGPTPASMRCNCGAVNWNLIRKR